MTFTLRPWVIWVLSGCTFAAVGFRSISAIASLQSDSAAFLSFPLAVLIPGLAFLFLATRPGMSSTEGALMQLGTMIQLSLIIALPGLALYLALGFPVVFLVVELFETRFPRLPRDRIKRLLIG